MNSKDTRDILILLGLLSFLAALMCQYFLLEGVPHVPDETNYIAQAQVFASGHRLHPEFIAKDAYVLAFWFNWLPFSASSFPFGWPLLLTGGVFLGISHLINPIICAILPTLGWHFFQIYHPEPSSNRIPLLSSALLAFSPGIWLMGASWMAHTSCLAAFFLLALGCKKRKWAWVGGLGWGYIILARPFDGIVLCGALFLLLFRNYRSLPWVSILLTIPFISGLFVLIDNWMITGDALQFPINMWFSKSSSLSPLISENCNRLGFANDIGCQPTKGSLGHSITKALDLASDSFWRLDRLLIGVKGMSVLVLIGIWHNRKNWSLVIFLFWVAIAYLPYWSPGEAYGARFWHPMYLVLPLFLGTTLSYIKGTWAWIALVTGILYGGVQMFTTSTGNYLCNNSELPEVISTIDRGVIFVHVTGQTHVEWDYLYSDPKTCFWGNSTISALSMETDKRHIRLTPRDPLQPALIDSARLQRYFKLFSDQPRYLIQYDLSSQAIELNQIVD